MKVVKIPNKKRKSLKVTITFEDRGQDFLEWTIRDGRVVDCRPFQQDLWIGHEIVSMSCIMPGDIVQIRSKAGTVGSIKYPVEKVTYEWAD
jgi:hypothetical protein